MKLILTHEVDNLGSPGDVVEVRDGYGRNYLVPQGLAITWSRGAEKQIDQIRRVRDARRIRDLGHAQQVKAQVEALKVTIGAKAGDSGQLFGRITEKDIIAAVKKAGGPDLDRRQLVADAVKHTGTHKVTVKLHSDVEATLAIDVVKA